MSDQPSSPTPPPPSSGPPMPPGGWQPPPSSAPGGWHPTNPPAPPAPKQNWFAQHKLLSGCLVLVVGFFVLMVLGLVAVAMSGGSSSSSGTSSSASAEDSGQSSAASEENSAGADAPAEAAAPGLGTPVRDGKFEFTVTAVEDGGAEIGTSEFLKEQAQGTFRLVHVTVTNIGAEPQTFFNSSQKVVDDQGRKFEPNSMAGLVLDGNEDVWIKPINPGNSVTGVLVFDMPADSTPVAIELHDSLFSSGVTVSLK